MPDAIRIALVDDHPFFLEGARRALQRVKDVKLVAQGSTATEAVKIAEEQRPDIMILDITMPGSGIEAAKTIRAAHPSIHIVFLTGSDDEDHVTAAISSGARGYVLKGADAAELMTAVRTVMAGQPYVTPALSMRMLFDGGKPVDGADSAALKALTGREMEILNLAAQGMTNADIARELGIALQTVKNAMSRILEKLSVRNRVEAIAAFLKRR